MVFLLNLLIEIDRDRGIVHLTADQIIRIEDGSQLEGFCRMVNDTFRELPQNRRYYLMVDISRIVIVPELARAYSEKVDFLCRNYLYAEGLVRYGHQITRLTARLGHEKYLRNDPHLFGTKQEAETYLSELSRKQAEKALNSAD